MDYAHIATGSEEEFVAGSTLLLKQFINIAIEEKGVAMVGLSGGSTPKAVYEALGKSGDIDWNNVWLCLVDERYVPADDDDSNAKLVQDSLLANAPIPEEQVVFPDTNKPLEECIAEYNTAIEHIKPDVIVLGMGSDGHTASLFPPLPESASGSDQVIHTTTEQFTVTDRISMTLPALKRPTSKLVLLKGDDKKATWEEMLESTEPSGRWPLKAVLGSGGVTLVSWW